MLTEIAKIDGGLMLDVVIRLQHGLHSRPSARLAQTARQFTSDILLINQEAEVDAKSMLDVLSLALKRNDHVCIVARGADAAPAIEALQKILTETGE